MQQAADHPEEILDLVDDNDTVVGTITRKDVYAQGIKNYRCVHAFIKNKSGKLWIPRRVATKKLYPSSLDFSVAGHVESGETYEEALIKEAREEVGIDLSKLPYKEIGYFNPHRDQIAVFQKCLRLKVTVCRLTTKTTFSHTNGWLPRILWHDIWLGKV